MSSAQRGGEQRRRNNIVTVQWLAHRLDRSDVVIADCRFNLADPEAGRRAYGRDHIPGAVFFDLDEHLSAPTKGEGGRHPLPSIDQFAAHLGEAGIDDGVTVVCYDDGDGSMAARLWWMLRYVGHHKVALLDGGYAAWQAAGKPVTAEPSSPVARRFTPRLQTHMVATMDDVRAMAASGRGLIVDSRAPERYRGEVEPLDPVAGHIPGAVNMPWSANLDASGRFLDDEALADRFARITSDGQGSDIVVHCGSGVTGCLNVLALEQAGTRGVRLYVGGWSEWCSRPDNPVATSADPGEVSAR